MATKPASRVIYKAIPRGNGFRAQFALPGLVPDLVAEGGQVVTFRTEQEAINAAMKAVLRLYDSRTIDTRKAGGYRRLSGAELATLLDQADMTVTMFAHLYGVPQHRVMKWIDGEQDVPHSAHVLAKLFAHDEKTIDFAEALTDEYNED